MFFWGSYNFQAHQLVEHPDRPPLKFPVYAPCPAGRARKGSQRPPQVLRVFCGQKHLVAEVEVEGSAGSAAVLRRLYGMGSNAYGQLGSRVPEYTTSLVPLYFEDVASTGDVLSVACGQRHTLICTASGSVYAAGDNSGHQLGVSLPHGAAAGCDAAARAAGADALGQSGGRPAAATTTGSLGFIPVSTNLAHVQRVFASHHSSFALDRLGRLYSWGSSMAGHLGHGNNGEQIDPKTLKTIFVDVAAPKLVEWFAKKRIVVEDVAVGKGHMVARSAQGDVYTCGEGYYGKLGSGDVASEYLPRRVEFPPRLQPEQVQAISAGDDHTVVLRQNPVVGAVVYYFGKLSNGDGQLIPMIVEAPPSVRSVVCGRGTQTFLITEGGELLVWGKHAYAKVANGTYADSGRSAPRQVQPLAPFAIDSVGCGGVFVVSVASRLRDAAEQAELVREGQRRAAAALEPEPTAVAADPPRCGRTHAEDHHWDVVVPYEHRSPASGAEREDHYDIAVRAFLEQYLGEDAAAAYVREMPRPAPAQVDAAYAFDRRGARHLQVGDKVRLWMTDVYALGTIAARLAAPAAEPEPSPGPAGCRYLLEWERDDWEAERVTLYSEDETVDADNPNRWQPFWFERRPDTGEYRLPPAA